MSGQTCRCRSRYSSSRSGRTFSRKPTRSTISPSRARASRDGPGTRVRVRQPLSEVEVVEVRRVEGAVLGADDGLAVEQDLSAVRPVDPGERLDERGRTGAVLP